MSDVMLLSRVGALAKYIKETGRDDIFTRQDLATIQIAQDELEQRADRISELEAVLEKLRLEASRASLFYPTDLALMQEEINSVLPKTPPSEVEG